MTRTRVWVDTHTAACEIHISIPIYYEYTYLSVIRRVDVVFVIALGEDAVTALVDDFYLVA